MGSGGVFPLAPAFTPHGQHGGEMKDIGVEPPAGQAQLLCLERHPQG